MKELQHDPELRFSCGAAYAAMCLVQAKSDASAAGEAAGKAADMLDECLALSPAAELAEKARLLKEEVLSYLPREEPAAPAYPYIPAATPSQ